MEPRIVAGPQMAAIGEALAGQLGEALLRATFERFPDGEVQVVLGDEVAGRQLALLQSLAGPVGERLIELVLLADACHRAGAAGLIAVIPYFAYARQDRARPHEPLGGEVIARLVSAGGFRRVIAVDLHSEAAGGWFGAPLEQVSAMTALADAVRPSLSASSVVVSPDLGGAKRAEQVARALGLPLAIVHKTRRSGEEVVAHRVLGEVRGRAAIIVDDLISTGGTIEAAVGALRAEGCADDISVLAAHALLVGKAVQRLSAARIRRLIHTDSVPVPSELPFEHLAVPLAPLLAGALRARP